MKKNWESLLEEEGVRVVDCCRRMLKAGKALYCLPKYAKENVPLGREVG